MPDFRLVAPFEPTGDQPAAIELLVEGLEKGLNHQVIVSLTTLYGVASVHQYARSRAVGTLFTRLA